VSAQQHVLRMSLREKCAQMVISAVPSTSNATGS
jgi:hypothetical protein